MRSKSRTKATKLLNNLPKQVSNEGPRMDLQTQTQSYGHRHRSLNAVFAAHFCGLKNHKPRSGPVPTIKQYHTFNAL